MKDGGPAFPIVASGADRQRGDVDYGASLRDWLAVHAPEMTEQWYEDSRGDGIHWLDAQAAWSYAYADAMIAERDKEA